MRADVDPGVDHPHDARFVDQHGLARGDVTNVVCRLVQHGQIAARVRDEPKALVDYGADVSGKLTPQIRRVHGDSQNNGVIFRKVKSLSTERTKMVLSPISEAFGEERYQNVLVPTELSQLHRTSFRVGYRERGGGFAHCQSWRGVPWLHRWLAV